MRCPTISPTGPPSNPLLLPLLSPYCKWEGHPQLKAAVEEEKKEQEGYKVKERGWAIGGANREREQREWERVREIGRESKKGKGRKGGGVQLIRVNGRCVRFRALLLPLMETAEGGGFWNYLKWKSRICYRWVVLYNLFLPLWFPLLDAYAVRVSRHKKY